MVARLGRRDSGLPAAAWCCSAGARLRRFDGAAPVLSGQALRPRSGAVLSTSLGQALRLSKGQALRSSPCPEPACGDSSGRRLATPRSLSRGRHGWLGAGRIERGRDPLQVRRAGSLSLTLPRGGRGFPDGVRPLHLSRGWGSTGSVRSARPARGTGRLEGAHASLVEIKRARAGGLRRLRAIWCGGPPDVRRARQQPSPAGCGWRLNGGGRG